MKVTYEQMVEGIKAANLRGAQKKGYATMEEYSIAQRKEAYLKKIAEYEKAILKMKKYIENN